MTHHDETEHRSPEHTSAQRVLGDVFWRRLDTWGLERCRLLEVDDGWRLEGIVLVVEAGEVPWRVDYVVACDPDWVTRNVRVIAVGPAGRMEMELRRDESGVWWRNAERLAGMDGLADVDLSLTPATNTPPIRRLRLGVGDSGTTDAVWVRFPDLPIERLPQRYTRIGQLAYRYESCGGAFTADLAVDDQGLVVRYSDIWERVGP